MFTFNALRVNAEMISHFYRICRFAFFLNSVQTFVIITIFFWRVTPFKDCKLGIYMNIAQFGWGDCSLVGELTMRSIENHKSYNKHKSTSQNTNIKWILHNHLQKKTFFFSKRTSNHVHGGWHPWAQDHNEV